MRLAFATCAAPYWLILSLAGCSKSESETMDSGVMDGAISDAAVFVSYNLVPNSDCGYEVKTTSVVFYPNGIHDVAEPRGSAECDTPYVAHLLVQNELVGRGLLLTVAEVTLTDREHRLLAFENLPNPFMVPVSGTVPPPTGALAGGGVATLTLIPIEYAQRFPPEHVDSRSYILSEARLLAVTDDGKDIRVAPFEFGIEICDGCLTVCAEADIRRKLLQEEDYIGKDQCSDNAGQDNRVCIDHGC